MSVTSPLARAACGLASGVGREGRGSIKESGLETWRDPFVFDMRTPACLHPRPRASHLRPGLRRGVASWPSGCLGQA